MVKNTVSRHGTSTGQHLTIHANQCCHHQQPHQLRRATATIFINIAAFQLPLPWVILFSRFFLIDLFSNANSFTVNKQNLVFEKQYFLVT
jgi:hypothetical protein